VGEVNSFPSRNYPALLTLLGGVFSRLENNILLVSAQLDKTDCFLMLEI
jgi:hypothetical protein